MKIPNFENKFYQDVYSYLTLIHGAQNIKHMDRYNCIEVNLSSVVYYLLYSGNEDKIYFVNVHPGITENLSYENNKLFKDFRVFGYEQAKKYIDFKKTENDLIKTIEG